MADISQLQTARDAASAIAEQKRLAERLPELERQHAREVERQNASIEEEIAWGDFRNSEMHYNKLKEQRDKQIEKLFTQIQRTIAAGKRFDNLCDGSADERYKSKGIDGLLGDIAVAQLTQLAPRNQIDNMAIATRKIELAKSLGIYPLCHYDGDRSGVKQEILDVLKEHMALNW